jgi:hypothetical protein
MACLSRNLAAGLSAGISSGVPDNALEVIRTFANAAARYFQNPVTGEITGPFAAGVPAVGMIGGKRFTQIERAGTNSFVQSGALDNVAWTQTYLTPTASTATDPNGLTGAYKCTPSTDDAAHVLSQAVSSKSVGSWFRDAGYGYGMLRGTDGADQISATVNIATGAIVAAETAGKILSLRSLRGPDGWCYGEMTTTVTMTTTSVGVSNASATASFAGDGTKAVDIWQPQASTSADYLHSLIKTTTGAVTCSKDQYTIAAAQVPTSFKDKVTAMFCPRWAGTDALADRTLLELSDTRGGNIRCYYDGSTKTMRIRGRKTPIYTASSGAASWGNYVDSSHVYTTLSGSGVKKIYRCGLNGSNITQFATTSGIPRGIAGDSTTIYWADTVGIYSMLKSDVMGTPTQLLALVGNKGQIRISTDGTKLFCADNSGRRIISIPIGGGTATDEVTGKNTWGVNRDTTNLYWSEIATGKVQYRPLSGGATVDLITGLTTPVGLAIDQIEDRIFVSDDNGSIKSFVLSTGVFVDTIVDTTVSGGAGLFADPLSKRLYFCHYSNATSNCIFRAPFSSGATTHSAYQALTVALDRAAGTLALSGFTTGNGTTTGTAWDRPDSILYVGEDALESTHIDAALYLEAK